MQNLSNKSKILQIINNNIWIVIIILTGIIYISNTWSPSSYAYILVEQLGAKESGPDLGKYRPIRSDEWSVNTALIQAMDKDDFSRFNSTSFYHEDLRINYGLPIRDWGLAFKPSMWLYGVIPSAYAYSFHWYLMMVAFIAGYAMLFRRLQLSNSMAILLSFSIFLTGQVQFWWNEKGPIFAIFPWIVLALTHQTKYTFIKLLFFYWLCTAWLLTNLYPPIQISLVFVAGILILAFFPEEVNWKNAVLYILVALVSAATAAFYLQDYLTLTAATSYPGSRVSAGGEARGTLFASWWFPALLFDHKYETYLPNSNICEIGTLGIYYSLFVAVFLNYKNLAVIYRDRAILITLIGFLTMAAWMYIPLPSWLGYPLLWNRVPGGRMEFAVGLLWVLLVVQISLKVGLQWRAEKVVVLLLLLLMAATANPKMFGLTHSLPLQQLLVLPIAAAGLATHRWHPARPALTTCLLSASLIAGMLFFGRFNPLQPAKPIFSIPDTPMMRSLTDIYKVNDHLLIHQIGLGATANGLGFRSISHINPVPHMEVWKKYFPDLSDSSLYEVFNRYAHIYVEDIATPEIKWLDAVKIPKRPFEYPWQVIIQPTKEKPPAPALSAMGHIDEIIYREDEIVISGWGGWEDMSPHRILEVYSDIPSNSGRVSYHLRSDLVNLPSLARYGANGFHLVLKGKVPHKLDRICLVARDSDTGQARQIHNPAGIAGCNTPEQSS